MQGRSLYESREYDKAEQILNQILQEYRGFADVYNMLGVIHYDKGRFAQAKSSFEQALQINPSYTEAALNLAVTYNDLSQYQDAKQIYSQAIMRTRNSPRSLDTYAKGKIANMHAELGDVYYEIGFFAEAVREYTQALTLCPTFLDIRSKLAGTYRDMGNTDAALREYYEIRSQNPNYVPARLQLGVTLYSVKRLTEAIAEWRAVMEIDSKNKSAQMYLKMVGLVQP